MSHYLYRFYKHGGELLYVGITNNPKSRFIDHRSGKTWFSEIYMTDVTEFKTRSGAAMAEMAAIAIKNPIHNEVRTHHAYSPLIQDCIRLNINPIEMIQRADASWGGWSSEDEDLFGRGVAA